MELVTRELIQELLSVDQVICLSLYMPTFRTHPEKLQNPIRFKNLVKQLEDSLLKNYPNNSFHKILEPMQSLINDNDLWNHTLNGLAVFSSNGIFEVVGLHETVNEMALVASTFHTKPLRKSIQSIDRYQILAIDLHEYHLYEGDRHSIVEIELDSDVPKTVNEALGELLTEKNTMVQSLGGAGRGNTIHQGHGSRKEEAGKDAERFFRIIANVIEERYSKPMGRPLLLAALPEHHHLFHKVSKNPYLMKEGIHINPSSLSLEDLNNLAWKIMEPEYEMKLDKIVNHYEMAKAHGRGSDEIDDIAVAAVEGRIDTLLVEAERIIAVRISNIVSGNLHHADEDNPKIDDLLDDMSELVTKLGGEVIVLPTEKMPSESGLAGIFRY